MGCDQFNVQFGSQVLTGVKWNIKRKPDTLYVKGLIYQVINGNKVSVDLTGWKINIPITSCDGLTVILNLTSEGGSPQIEIIDGPDQPYNFTIEMANAALVAAFPKDGSFPVSFITTDAGGIVLTRWEGSAVLKS